MWKCPKLYVKIIFHPSVAENYRAIFNWVSKVIRDCIGFALLRSVIGLETRATLSTDQMQN